MAYATRRSYAGAAPSCTLTNDISSSAVSFSLTGDVTNWNTTASGPFFAVIDPGLATEEKILVASRTSTTLSSITRGVDGTVPAGHSAGAICYPVFTAVDADQANAVASALTTKGDLLVTDGSVLNRLAVGTNAYMLLADSTATNGVVWGQVAAAGIASDAVTTVKILDSAVTSAKIANDTIVDADINSAAAIALSKLATTGTVTATTFVGALTGNVTGNVTGSSGSCTGNAATATSATTATTATTATNVAYSGLTGTVPTWNQNTTGNAATATNATNATNATYATYLNGFNKGSNVVTTNSSGLASYAHGLGSAPTVILVHNGDLGAYFGQINFWSVDGTNITIAAGANLTVRVNWVAYL